MENGLTNDAVTTPPLQDYLPPGDMPKWHGADSFIPYLNGFRSMEWDTVYHYFGPRTVHLSVNMYVQP